MAARLAAGRIGGLPVAGGHISLENAEMAQVIDATTGLVRELTGTGIKLAALGVGGALLLGMIDAQEKAKAARERDRAENPPRSLSGICTMNWHGSRVYGICLNRTISFKASGTSLSVPTEHVVAIQRETESSILKWVRITLIDGSVLRHAELAHKVELLTLAGVASFIPDNPCDIHGLEVRQVEGYKERLVEGLKQTRTTLLNEIGIDLVRKYFHIEDAVFEEVTEPTLRLPAQPAASPPLEKPSAAFTSLAIATLALTITLSGMALHALFGS